MHHTLGTNSEYKLDRTPPDYMQKKIANTNMVEYGGTFLVAAPEPNHIFVSSGNFTDMAP